MKNKFSKGLIIIVSIAAIGYGAFRITEYIQGIVRWNYAKIKMVKVADSEIDHTPLEE